MKETIGEIRDLLGKLEEETEAVAETAAVRALSGFELPDILRDVIDLLMPMLRPYEAAFYMYIFRHSILETGNPHVRVSTYRLQDSVVKSTYTAEDQAGTDLVRVPGGRRKPDERSLSPETVRRALKGLEISGAIRKEGEPNRDGTLYRILLPEEIDACKVARAQREVVSLPSVAPQDIDYYNVRENRAKVYERDGYKCRYCTKQLTRFMVTLDHVKPVAERGDNSLENLATACLECNSKKNARLLGDFIAEARPTK